nr:hypothetical protein GCM10020063_099760 [Dactylosporangium thailandense]
MSSAGADDGPATADTPTAGAALTCGRENHTTPAETHTTIPATASNTRTPRRPGSNEVANEEVRGLRRSRKVSSQG